MNEAFDFPKDRDGSFILTEILLSIQAQVCYIGVFLVYFTLPRTISQPILFTMAFWAWLLWLTTSLNSLKGNTFEDSFCAINCILWWSIQLVSCIVIFMFFISIWKESNRNFTQYNTPDISEERSLASSLPSIFYKPFIVLKSKECSICLLSYTEDEWLKLLPQCLHSFHSSWISVWLSHSLSCPICRTKVAKENWQNPSEEEISEIFQ